MRPFAFRLIFALWPLFLGLFLPYVGLFGIGRFVNLFWGTIYGFGLLLTDWIFANSVKSPVLLLGVIVWPIFVSTLLFIVAGKLGDNTSNTGRGLAFALVIASAFIVVPLSRVSQPPFSAIPTFWKLMFVVW